jgi:hypothetical protein
MPQMTIYLTENLKARIEKLEGFHASRIAKEAIQEAVEKEEGGERNPQGRNKLELAEREWIVRLVQNEIATAIERLRKSKEEQAVFWNEFAPPAQEQRNADIRALPGSPR